MPLPLPAALDDFLADRATRKPSAHTLKAYRNDVLAVAAHAAELVGQAPETLDVGALTAPVMRRAFARFAADHAAASIARAWSTWNQLFTFLVAEDAVAGNPMAAVPKPKLPPSAPKPLRGETTPALLLERVAAGARQSRDPWPERDLAVIATLLLTGLRLAELLSLTVGSLEGEPGEQTITVTGKGGKERAVPVEPALDVVLGQYLESRKARFPDHRIDRTSPLWVDRRGEPLRRGGLQYLVGTCVRSAGLGNSLPKGALVHAFRHTYGTQLVRDGASVVAVQRLMGHASLSTTQRYVDATAAELREAAAANRTYQALRNLTGDGPPG